ncbi:MAG: glycosyltransferase family 39 protein [Gallionella sp.]|nr:glycosyltransferase family 39 protein [Gallionella sp.]
MKTTLKNINSSFKLLFHLSVLILISVCVSIIFPMFFRSDDAQLLYWAAHHNLNDLFNVHVINDLIGRFLPFTFGIWIAEYRLFGLNPFGYQVTNTSIFLLDFYLLYYLCKTYFDKSSGIVTLVIYCVLFYNHFQMAFWFADICFSLHLMFAFLSIIFYLKSKENIRYIIVSYLFAFMGILTKEPSIIIVISFVFADWLVHVPKKDCLKKAWVLLPYVGIVIWLLLISPVLESRFKQSVDATTFLYNLDYRYRFYFDFLLSGTKKLIPLLLSISFAASIPKALWVKLLVILLSIPCYYSSYYYIVFLFAISGLFVVQQTKLLPFFFWMLLTSLTLPFMGFITPTYLFEFSFGFAIFLGYIVNKQLIEKINFQFFIAKKGGSIALIVFLLFGVAIAVKPVISQVKALRLVVETRRNLAEGIDFIAKNKDKIAYVVVPDQENNESYEDKAKNSIRSNADKAKSIKTMDWTEIKQYLSLLKLDQMQVLPYSDYIKSPVVGPTVVFLLQNDTDIQFAINKGLIDEKLFSYSHYKTNNLLISSIKEIHP